MHGGGWRKRTHLTTTTWFIWSSLQSINLAVMALTTHNSTSSSLICKGHHFDKIKLKNQQIHIEKKNLCTLTWSVSLISEYGIWPDPSELRSTNESSLILATHSSCTRAKNMISFKTWLSRKAKESFAYATIDNLLTWIAFYHSYSTRWNLQHGTLSRNSASE